MAMKYPPLSSPTSLVCTTFGWFNLAASLASSRNIPTNSGSGARWPRSTFSTWSLLNPAGPLTTAR